MKLRLSGWIETILILAIFSGIIYYIGRPPAKAPPADLVQTFSVERIGEGALRSHDLAKPTVFVFWATWCPPCKIELARLQRLVSAGAIASDQVVAVSVGEDRQIAESTAKERGYTFQVALDEKSEVALQYAVSGTPTILFRNSDGTVAWRSSGISPTLELRTIWFLSR